MKQLTALITLLFLTATSAWALDLPMEEKWRVDLVEGANIGEWWVEEGVPHILTLSDRRLYISTPDGVIWTSSILPGKIKVANRIQLPDSAGSIIIAAYYQTEKTIAICWFDRALGDSAFSYTMQDTSYFGLQPYGDSVVERDAVGRFLHPPMAKTPYLPIARQTVISLVVMNAESDGATLWVNFTDL